MLKQSYSGQNYNYIFKVVVVGSMGVGKTSIITRYCDSTFENKYHSTIGVDFRVKFIEYKDNHIKMQIWDTAGQEQFELVTTDYQYKGTNGILAVFDLGCKQSFDSLSRKIEHILKNELIESAHIILVGNKSDMSESREVQSQEIIQLTQKHNIQYFETNVTEQQFVDQVFQKLLDVMIRDGVKIQNSDNFDAMSLISHDAGSINLNLNNKTKKKSGCC